MNKNKQNEDNLEIISCTMNYKAHCAAISQISIVDIIRAVDYINLLAQFVNDENEILDDLDDITAPFDGVIKALRTGEQCRHLDCGSQLYMSDLPQYDFVCPECDENF